MAAFDAPDVVFDSVSVATTIKSNPPVPMALDIAVPPPYMTWILPLARAGI